jgi:hypothetical protein
MTNPAPSSHGPSNGRGNTPKEAASPKRANSNNRNRNRNRPQQKRPKADAAAVVTPSALVQTPAVLLVVPPKASPPPSGSNLAVTDQRFADLPISSDSRRALKEVFGYEFMTPVQAETLPAILRPKRTRATASQRHARHCMSRHFTHA